MATRADRRSGDLRYFAGFGLTAAILIAATLVLVLVVLPQRYVLSAGFVESGLNFPDPDVPFAPLDPVRIAAIRTRVAAEAAASGGPVPRGPAELFWDRVLPLLERGRFAEALPIFDGYLAERPGDRSVREEHARTLIAAGRADEAVPILAALADRSGDRDHRLLLARTLRDLGRLDEASAEYMRLAEAAPADEGLALEWARALSWPERYDAAEDVLRDALARIPGSAPIRAELARVLFYGDRLAEAEQILEAMTDAEIVAADAAELRDAVRAALVVPEPPEAEVEPPTVLELAMAARDAGDFDEARALLEGALADDPDDADAWLGLANLLQYELDDFEGARTALLEVERLGGDDTELRWRLSLLDAWTARGPSATRRLQALLADLESGAAQPAVPTDGAARIDVAEVRALMGDVQRWEGDRVAADAQYTLALASEPENDRARAGREAVEVEVALRIDEVEAPRFGSHAYALGDTDDFERLDVGLEWVGVRDHWAWRGTVGRTWLAGREPGALPAELRGTYVEIAPARWWRLGTLRGELRAGARWVRENEIDPTLGARLEYRGVRGATASIDYTHDAAYPLTATLQSVVTGVTMDRLLVGLSRPLGRRWSLTFEGDLARLDAPDAAGSDPTTRAQGGLVVAYAAGPGLALGWSGSALAFSDPAPAPRGLRLFWDPTAAYVTGPFARIERPLSARWAGSVRVAPGLALIDERPLGSPELVPQLSAEAGVEWSGDALRAALDLFYGQARVGGYRTYGMRVSVSGPSWLSRSPGR